jgi:hypothetical protein
VTYTYEVHKVVWYAELGWVTGDERGLWERAKESHGFPTKSEAESFIHNYPGIQLMRWGEYRPPWMYGTTRVRRGTEIVETYQK